MIPTHEVDHITKTEKALETVSQELALQWQQAVEAFQEAELYEAFLQMQTLLVNYDLSPALEMDIQLQLIRCLRYGPTRRIEEEHESMSPQNDYQSTVWWYRYGWYCLHRLEKAEEASHYLRKAKNQAREIDNRPWECAAQLQLGHAETALGRTDEAVEHFTRVYNLSRRNGLIEYISKATMGKGMAYIEAGEGNKGRELLEKAFDLAERNELVAEEGLALLRLAKFYHKTCGFYGLAAEYYKQAQRRFDQVVLWPSKSKEVENLRETCVERRNNLDIAKLLGPLPIDKLRKKYLSGLVNGFVGIPGIDNRSQLGERVDLTRQAIHRNINKEY